MFDTNLKCRDNWIYSKVIRRKYAIKKIYFSTKRFHDDTFIVMNEMNKHCVLRYCGGGGGKGGAEGCVRVAIIQFEDFNCVLIAVANVVISFA